MIIKIANLFPAGFISKVKDLYKNIGVARQNLAIEFKQKGRNIPQRIKFEELNLSEYKDEMLEVHRILQWQKYNKYLDEYTNQARIVAIAGICELIKDEYIGKFWDLYKKYMDRGATSFVYNWIWEQGFKADGIELIRSEWRREFVQSLVQESGIPRKRNKELIEFFILYWRYFRQFSDIESLINDIVEGTIDLSYIPPSDRKKLSELTKDAIEYTRAFSNVVSRLTQIFNFIERSDIYSEDLITEKSELIYKGCGVDPYDVLRDQDQLKKLYHRILNLVTPDKLDRLLARQLPGTKIRIPQGIIIRVDEYDQIMFGIHNLGGVKLICAPTLAYTLEELDQLPYNQVIRNSNNVFLKAKSMISVMVNCRNRPDLVRKFYSYINEKHSKFSGYIFYCQLKPAMSMELRTEDDEVHETVCELDGTYCVPQLQYNYRKNKHHLSIHIPGFRIKMEDFANKKIVFLSEYDNESLFELELDDNGIGIYPEQNIILNSPFPGNRKYTVIKKDSLLPLVCHGKEIEYFLNLDEVMLFSKSSQRKLFSKPKGISSRYGGKRFVLFLSSKYERDRVEANNLRILETDICGKYEILEMEWVDKNLPCQISIGDRNWEFDRCLEFKLFLNKKEKEKIDFVELNERQSRKTIEFELNLYPVPPEEIKEEIFWNIIVNNGSPYQIRYQSGPRGTQHQNCIRFSGNEIKDLLKPIWDCALDGNARIEIFICNSEGALSGVKFWLFPELEVEVPGHYIDGSEVSIKLQIDQARQECVILKDKRGRSKSMLNLNLSTEGWKAIQREYTNTYNINTLGTSIDLKLIPTIFGFRLGSKIKELCEVPRDMLRQELEDYDLITVSHNSEPPELMLNLKKMDLKFKTNGNISIIPLNQLIPFITEKETILRALKDNLHTTTFKIKYRLNIKNAEIYDHLINGLIMGKISYRGPLGSVVQFNVYSDKIDTDDNVEIVSFEVDCDGQEHENLDFNIDLNTIAFENYESYIVKIKLINEIEDTLQTHDYGESWIIKKDKLLESQDYDYLKSAAISYFDQKKYFEARRFYNFAREVAPELESEWLNIFKNQIKDRIVRLQVNDLVEQVRMALRKEYLIETKIVGNEEEKRNK